MILDEAADIVIGKAKSLTMRGDLALGIGRAVDAALEIAGVAPAQIALVSLSTTLATNALVEGQGGRAALIAIGYDGPVRPEPFNKPLNAMDDAEAAKTAATAMKKAFGLAA